MSRRFFASLVLVATLLLVGGGGSADAASDPVLAAAGDIACNAAENADSADYPQPQWCQQAATASLITSMAPTAVAALGDEQYENGTLAEFDGAGAYDATWGVASIKPRTYPVPGNHEYGNGTTAADYFTYFGAVAGDPSKGYYSYNLGSWHIVALNSNCTDSGCTFYSNLGSAAEPGSVATAEVTWLKNDLAAHQGMCTLAYWHHPLFAAGWVGGSPGVKPFWDALYAHGADVVLNAHDHVYERYGPLNPSGASDNTRGVREFDSATGGRVVTGFPSNPTAASPPVQAYDGSHHGVLFLTLHSSSYDWSFHAVDGSAQGLAEDHGTTNCHEPQASISITPTSPTAGQSVSFNANASAPDGTISSYSWNFGDGATSTATAPTHTYASAGTYTASVTVTSSSGETTTTTTAVSVGPAASTAYRDAVLGTSGLVSYWRLGEGSGPVAFDSKGTNNGSYGGGVTLAQPGALASDPNTAASFDGTGYVSLPNLGSYSSFSVEGWTKLNSASVNSPNGNNTLYGHSWQVRLIPRPSGVYADVAAGGAVYGLQAATPNNVGAWVYWVLVRSGASMTIYRNGSAVASTSQLPSGPTTLGGSIAANSGSQLFLHGSADEVAVYNTALTPPTIQQHYTAAGQ